MASKKGCFFTFLKLVFLILIVLLVLLISLFLLATGAPASYPAPEFDGEDTGVVANIITRLARSLVDKEGRVVETAVLRLNQGEVQTLLDAAIAKSNDQEAETLPYAAAWDDGKLRVHYSLPVSANRAANISAELTPVVDNGSLTLTPRGGSMGHFPLPGGMLDFAAKKLEQMAMRNDSTRTMLSAFTRIEPGDDGNLLLMFDPRNVNTVIRILRSAGSLEDPDADDEADGTDDPDEETDEYEETDEEDESDEDFGE